MKNTRNIAVLIFDNVELMDFCGPYDVFSIGNKMSLENPFNIFTVSESAGEIITQNGLSVNSKYNINNCPKIDILIIPGGQGSRKEMKNKNLLNWIKSCYLESELILSVCTGALLLANCQLLDGLSVTTHHNAIELLKQTEPKAKIVADKRFVDNGNIILSAGVSSGIDMSLYVLGKLLGQDLVLKVKENMEYDWKA
jgi:transcriptional regulator GlxA family with amidase domain